MISYAYDKMLKDSLTKIYDDYSKTLSSLETTYDQLKTQVDYYKNCEQFATVCDLVEENDKLKL